jgi:hypothetical protein
VNPEQFIALMADMVQGQGWVPAEHGQWKNTKSLERVDSLAEAYQRTMHVEVEAEIRRRVGG